MKPTVIVTREKGKWIANVTVTEDKEAFSASGEDSDPQVAVYRGLYSLYACIADHYKKHFQITVTL